MAERDSSPDESRKNTSPVDDSILESEEAAATLELDLGDDQTRKFDLNRLGRHQNISSAPNICEAPRREDNPFSFKHFLQSDSGNFQNKGARPKAKVYFDGRVVSSVSDVNLLPSTDSKSSRIVPEFSSALPDFVQDHLIVEQCYLGNQANNFNLDIDNLPDFTPDRQSSSNRPDNRGFRRSETNEFAIPLDLPTRPQAGFPLDLPLSSTSQQNNARNPQLVSEVGVSKSLPDFLADGAVHSQSPDGPSLPSTSLEREVERLRQELDQTRRDLAEQKRRADMLNVELELAKNKEHEYTQNLIKALEQVEENLERSNRRASSAELTIVKLRQEIKSLTIQVNHLKSENKSLREEEGAVGGAGYFNMPNEIQYQRLAQELRTAASSAEHSLRQLLTGVDNLRIMAASLENMHRIEEKDETFLGHDDETGPAL